MPETISKLELFDSYHWLILHTDPFRKRMYLKKSEPPLYIKNLISSLTIDELFNKIAEEFILKDIPFYKIEKKGKEISTIEDVKRLWKDAGFKEDNCPYFGLFLKGIEYSRIQHMKATCCSINEANSHDCMYYNLDSNGSKESKIIDKYLQLQRLRIRKEIEINPLKNTVKQGKDKALPQLQIPKNTKWQDIEIVFINNHTINIKVNRKFAGKKNYSEVGFKDERTNKPIKAWDILIGLCGTNGILRGFSHAQKPKIEKTISGLRDKLRQYFGINDDPIPYIKKEGYKTVFKISNHEDSLCSKNLLESCSGDMDSIKDSEED
ncbi:MAG: hypothetical protein E3K37_17400 [Candidatus Kuenenia sp.]|nr:hypothetical protein [Candidatus Kuenenia hertensis]